MLPLLTPPVLACTLSARGIAQIDRAAKFVMRRGHVPGISLGVSRNGRILCERAYGERNLARKLPAEPQTRYAIGSITKQFTAAAVLQLVADGKLALGQRMGTLLPSYPNAANVTVRELLNQTSGIPDYADRPGFDRDASDRVYAPTDLLGLVRSLPLDFAPGTRWEYSNTNYVILGMLIENAAGEPFARYLRRNVLGPLGLHDTVYGAPPAGTRDLALGYRWNGAENVPAPPTPAGAVYSAGALSSTAGDLLNWDAALLAYRVLDPSSTAMLFTPGTPTGGASDGYGFGFFIARMYGWRVYEHSGYVDGFSAVDVLVPGARIAIAVLSDEDATDMTPLAQSILAAVEPPKDAWLSAGRFAPVENENLRVTARVRSLVGRLISGRFDPRSLAVSLTPVRLARLRSTLAGLGPPKLFEFVARSRRDGIEVYRYRVTLKRGRVWIDVGYGSGGRIVTLTLRRAD